MECQKSVRPGKIDNAIMEIERLRLNILTIDDVLGPGTRERLTKNGMIYFSNNDNSWHRDDVGLIDN